MDEELFSALEKKVADLLDSYVTLKHENARMSAENLQLLEERNRLMVRIDAVLKKLEGI